MLLRKKALQLQERADRRKVVFWQRWKTRFCPFKSEVEAVDLAVEFMVRWGRTVRNKSKLYQMPSKAYQVAYEWARDPRSKFEVEQPFTLKLEPLSTWELSGMKINPTDFALTVQEAMHLLDAGEEFLE
jgi:hypothetical protein